MFEFKIEVDCSKTKARTGRFTTAHGDIETPVFMPVGTGACVKTMAPWELEDLGAQIILGNTFHLYLRPGEDLIHEAGGLHKFSNWKKPILTDSGGFQVFSLAKMRKISEEGVEFSSHLDGSKHFFSPEKVMEIETKLGADIIMAFDECPDPNAGKNYIKNSLKITHDWAIRCKNKFEELSKQNLNDYPQALFPICQGAIHDDLRIESAKFVSDLDLPGLAIGGLSVGEKKEEMLHTLEVIEPHLTREKPRYLMGVGSPDDLVESVARGVDMFDCVIPTRLGRHGAYFTEYGRENIKKEINKNNFKPLMENCSCAACKNFSKAYLRHLFIGKEILALRMLTVHNLHFLLNMMKEIRKAIQDDKFEEYRKDFWNNWEN
ncbi:MAG: tRNA guanosine(34) transglycosylase Tgt [Minisyncoccales bacterium]